MTVSQVIPSARVRPASPRRAASAASPARRASAAPISAGCGCGHQAGHLVLDELERAPGVVGGDHGLGGQEGFERREPVVLVEGDVGQRQRLSIQRHQPIVVHRAREPHARGDAGLVPPPAR